MILIKPKNQQTTANTADGTAAAATDAQGGYEGKEVKVWISSGAEDDIYREMFRTIFYKMGDEICGFC